MDPHALEPSYYLRTLWNGKWYILLATVVACAAMVIYAQRRPAPLPTYYATVTILVQEASAEGAGGGGAAKAAGGIIPLLTSPSEETINTQIALVTSRSVLEGAVRKLQAPGEEPTPERQAARLEALRISLKAEAITKTNLIKITASARSALNAERRANAVADSYIEYARAERIRSIQEAIDKITEELQGVGTRTAGDKQALAAAPHISAELASIQKAVLTSALGLRELQGETRAGAVSAVRLELPLMERSVLTLDSVSNDLKEMSENLKGRQRRGTADATRTLTAQADALEQTGSSLYAIGVRIQSILAQFNKLDVFETAARDADQAAASLDLLQPKSTQIQFDTLTQAQKMSAISEYAGSVQQDLKDIAALLRQAVSAGSGLTKGQRDGLRSQVTSYRLGLTAAAADLTVLRSTETDTRVYGDILTVEGYVGSALEQLTHLTAELGNLDQLATLQDELSKARASIEDGRFTLVNASTVLKAQDGLPPAQVDGHAVAVTHSDVSRIMLVLNVASQQLREEAAKVNAPYVKAQVNEVADDLWSIAPGGDAALVEQLIEIQTRVRAGGDQLRLNWETADAKLRNPDLAQAAAAVGPVHAAARDVANSMNVAFQQLTTLQAQKGLDPLVAGQLNALALRLSAANTDMAVVVSRFETAAKNISKNPPRELMDGLLRLEASAESLGLGASTYDSAAAAPATAVSSDILVRVNDHTDAAAAILTWVADSLMKLTAAENDPARFGRLAVLEGRIRASQIRTAQVSKELQLLEGAQGPKYAEMISLQQRLQLDLLTPRPAGISRIDSAVLPLTTARTAFFYNIRIPLGAVAGLLIGSLFVLVRDQSDNTVRTLSKLRAQVAATPLGVIPRDKARSNPRSPVGSTPDASTFSEALQLVGIGLSETLKDGARSLLVTSAWAKEGKTTLAVHLAQLLARQGRRVLLVDADLRKPNLAEALGLPNEDGLGAALARGQNPLDLVQPVNNFWALTAGAPTVNPIELLFSDAMSFFMKQAGQQYDVVLVDGPPILGYADTRALAKSISKAILVVRSGASSVDRIKQAQEELHTGGIVLAGTVLNLAGAAECSHLKHPGYPVKPDALKGRTSRGGGRLGWMLKPLALFGRLLSQ